MQCTEAKNQFDEYLDGMLNVAGRTTLLGHVDFCSDCHEELVALQALRNAMRELPVEPPRPNFAAEAMKAATGGDITSRDRKPGKQADFMLWFGTGFAGAMVAGLVLWGVFFGFRQWQEPTPAASFNIAVYQQKNIALAFNAPSDVKGVTVSIDLPEHFELAGHEGRRQLTWTTDLKKGRNVLKLPVVASGVGDGTMVATLSRDKQVKTLRILLTAGKPGLSQYRNTSETAV